MEPGKMLKDGSSLPPGPVESPQLGWPMLKDFLREQVRQHHRAFYRAALAVSYIGMFAVIDAIVLKMVIENIFPSDRLSEEVMANIRTCVDDPGWARNVGIKDVGCGYYAEDGGGHEHCQKDKGSGGETAADACPAACLVCEATEASPAGSAVIAVVVAGAYFVASGLYHYADRKQLCMQSTTRQWLRNTLVVHFLSMSEGGHDGLTDGDFFNTCFLQVELLVIDGWYQCLSFIRYTVQVMSLFIFVGVVAGMKVPGWASHGRVCH
jgi:hypothetical protein